MERRKFLKGTIAGALTATSAPNEQKTLEERALSNDAMELFEICQKGFADAIQLGKTTLRKSICQCSQADCWRRFSLLIASN